MLASDDQSVMTINGALWGLAGTVITGGGAWLLKYLSQRSVDNRQQRVDTMQDDRQRRIDAMGEWKALYDSQQTQVHAQQEQIESLMSKMADLAEKHAECEARQVVTTKALAQMTGEVRQLRVIVFQLQKGCTLEKGCPLMMEPGVLSPDGSNL